MAERGIDLLIVLPQSDPIDVLYLSGGEQGAIVFAADADPWILLGGEDSNLAVEREGWISQRESATPFGSTKVPYGAAVADKLERLSLKPPRVGIAGLDGDLYSHVRSADGYAIYSSVRRIIDVLEGCEIVNASPVMSRSLREERSGDRRIPRSASRSPRPVLARSVRRSASARRKPMPTAPASQRCCSQASVFRRSRGAPDRGRRRGRGSSAPRQATCSTAFASPPRSCRARG